MLNCWRGWKSVTKWQFCYFSHFFHSSREFRFQFLLIFLVHKRADEGNGENLHILSLENNFSKLKLHSILMIISIFASSSLSKLEKLFWQHFSTCSRCLVFLISSFLPSYIITFSSSSFEGNIIPFFLFIFTKTWAFFRHYGCE